MKKKLLFFILILLFLVSIVGACKIQSVEEYHKDTEHKVSMQKNPSQQQPLTETTPNEIKDAQEKDTVKKENIQNTTKEKTSSNKSTIKNKKNNPKKSNITKSNPIRSTSSTSDANKNDQSIKHTDQTTTKQDKTPSEPIAPAKEFVTISIRCDTILKNYDQLDPTLKNERFVPSNGIILKNARFELQQGESAFDLLVKATRKHRIHLDYQGNPQNKQGSVYIKGIHNLYEFSCGSLSGWMFQVNGDFPKVGVNHYLLKNGDHMQWNYTCDLGKDLGTSF